MRFTSPSNDLTCNLAKTDSNFFDLFPAAADADAPAAPPVPPVFAPAVDDTPPDAMAAIVEEDPFVMSEPMDERVLMEDVDDFRTND